MSKIEALVAKKTRWTREKLLLQKQHLPQKPKEYVSGKSASYLGRNYRLKIETGATKEPSLKNVRLIVQVPRTVHKREQYIQKAIVVWYRARATEKLREKVERYSGIVGVTPSSVSIKTYKGR